MFQQWFSNLGCFGRDGECHRCSNLGCFGGDGECHRYNTGIGMLAFEQDLYGPDDTWGKKKKKKKIVGVGGFASHNKKTKRRRKKN